MVSTREDDVLAASQARVYAHDGDVVGAGFLLTGDLLCTCAHVVAGALGLPVEGTDVPPDAAVEFDFPLLPGSPRARASVTSWRPGADVALLRLDEPVAGTRPAPMAGGTRLWGHGFRVLGFPVDAGPGVWAYGTLRARQGSGWLQMETSEPGPRIAEGFSGAPVWDDDQQAVAGMTVTAHLEERTAYLVPSADLVGGAGLEPPCPFQGLASFTEDHAAFFHGRDADTERLTAAVLRRPLTLVAGPSGCGKSSLVRAGVLPRLRADGAAVTELRPMPGVRPHAVLARALAGVLEPEAGEVERLARSVVLTDLLAEGDVTAGELRARVLARSGSSRHVLFVDQLEEYVGPDPAAGRKLLGLLAELAGGQLRIVATARPGSLDALNTADTSDLVSDAVQFLAPLGSEGLTLAVTVPVEATPGVWFEERLPERIVDDAGDEPGRMPLVQFALTQLWKRRSGGTLTHAAYDEMGGVAGALIGYADETFAELPSAEQRHAKRLFTQLARPDDGGAFVRRPTRVADLAPELVDVARELAKGKLVVLSRTPGTGEHEEIVELAHEALTAHWPALTDWLTESRDFRQWQEQVRADLARWQTQQREPARLLSGTDLAEAEGKLRDHPDRGDISAAEREYIRLSSTHARRGTRIRWAAVSALGVLTVLAVILSVTTYQNLRRAEGHLRTQAAGLLAQAAERRPPHAAASSLQLALAAWNAENTPDTRQALMDQYVRAQFVTAAHPSLWRGNISSLYASENGKVLLAVTEPPGAGKATLTLITGALDGAPRARELGNVPEGALRVAVSPDGRFVAAHGGGGFRLWRTDGNDRNAPTVLEPGPHERPGTGELHLDFSSDSRRLLAAFGTFDGCEAGERGCASAYLDVWETDSGDRLKVHDRFVARSGVHYAAFTSDRDALVFVVRREEGDGTGIEVRDLSSGRRLYSRDMTSKGGASTELRAGGETVVNEEEQTGIRVGRTPGKVYKLLGGQLADATTGYTVAYPALSDEADRRSDYTEQVLVDVRTGLTYRTRVPDSGDASVLGSAIAVVPRKGGNPRVLAAVGSDLLELRSEEVGSERFEPNFGDDNDELSPDGQTLARVGDDRLQVLDTDRGRQRSLRLPEESPSGNWELTWTSDSRHIVLWTRDGRLGRAYAVRDSGFRSVPLGSVLQGLDGVQAVAGTGGSDIAVITRGYGVARIDASDGSVTDRPFSVHRPADDDKSLNGIVGAHQLVARPRHPGQAAIVTTEGAERGEIQLWDLRGPRRIDVLRGSPVDSLAENLQSGSHREHLAFDRSGNRLAVVNQDSMARVWDVPGRKQSARGVLWTTDDGLAGLTPDGYVVSYREERFRFQSVEDSQDVFTIPAVAGRGRIHGHQFVVDAGTVRQEFDLRPERQFEALCEAMDRDFTAAERKDLPAGTPDGPPCS